MSTAPALSPSARVQSVDLLRGIIMVIMALDHVRDFFSATPFDPVDVTQTTPAWFLTRWITHFCAPLFVMLAGLSAYLYSTKVSKGEWQKFLLTRGLWLIFMEIFVVNFIFNFTFLPIFLQVIWIIGVCLILLIAFAYLPRWALIGFTVLMLAGHNLLDNVHMDAYGWKVLHEQYFGPPMAILYPLLPWPAILLLGYLLGEWFLQDPAVRKRKLLILGGSFVFAFLVIRTMNVYGDAHQWSVSDRGWVYTVLDFINVSKYPPSLLYALITLGPALLVLPFLEKFSGKVAAFFLTFGKVPFFFYLLHFFFIHVAAIAFNGVVYGEWRTWAFGGWPDDFVPSLLTTYVVWVVVIVILYFPCRWFVEVKKTNSAWWLKYL